MSARHDSLHAAQRIRPAARRSAAPCVSCGGRARALGPLPGSNYFAGRRRAAVLDGGVLYRCGSCFLGFRHPRPDKQTLDALYATGSDSAWHADANADRADWAAAADMIERHAGPTARVLDIGCFDGGFLAHLPDSMTKSGIEILEDAARRARAKGVTIVGSDFSALGDQRAAHDAVTAFDVIEHVEHPLAFLEAAAAAVKPGGILVLSTGNLDAWSWRLMRHRYWYCAIPEHICFLSERWFAHAARTLGLHLLGTRRYAHARLPALRQAREVLANLAFLVAPRAVAALRRRGVGHLSAELAPELHACYPPGWLSASDHIVVTLRRPVGA